MRLKVSNIDFYYDSIKALENVTFEVNEGELLGIIGPNGSGKTTLLRCINRALKPKVGTVLIDGRDISKWGRKEIAREIGTVPQGFITSFPFTAFDIVLMGRNPHLDRFSREGKRDLAAVKNAMELTNTQHLAERRIDELSGGERQRVIIARALAQEPSVLLLDEPTLHLDVNHQLEILGLLRALTCQSRLTVVLVSHDLNLAARFCDRLMLLNSGKVHSIGTPDEVLTQENMRQVYHVNTEVRYHSLTRSYNIVLLSPTNGGG